VAIGCALLVFALGIFAVSPSLHDQLHAGTHVSSDDGCAVTLFAFGVSVTLPLTAQPPVSAGWGVLPAVAAAEILVDSPRFLLPPQCGPPVG
jgi:hypothetical protein